MPTFPHGGPGCHFLNAIAEVIELPIDTWKVTIEAEVNGLVNIRVDRRGIDISKDELGREIAKHAKACDAVVTEVFTEPPSGFPYSIALEIDGQVVRYEAPTLYGLMAILERDTTDRKVPDVPHVVTGE